MTSMRLLPAALIAAGYCSTALAQDFFDFGTIPGVPAEPSVEVDLNPAMLSFVAQAAQASGTDAAGALDGLKNVRVRVYEELTDPNAVSAFVDESSRALDNAGWQRAVFVADDEDKVRVYVKTQGQDISGMTLMVLDDEEAVFINIDGTINPTQLGRLASMMGVGDALGSFGGRGPGARQDRNEQQHPGGANTAQPPAREGAEQAPANQGTERAPAGPAGQGTERAPQAPTDQATEEPPQGPTNGSRP